MQDIDTSRAPLGALKAQVLIDAVAEQGDMAERHYLELKSSLDLSTKKDKEKIAKFILGAANRMPEVASAAFEGYGVMIAGVAEGAITGIAPVEMMEISKVVQKYVGAAGPRWDVVWVSIEGSANQVLIVLVEPPQIGQSPFPCRANGDSLTDGRIYIRAEGETREANADEFDLLIQRGLMTTPIEIDFAVEVFGEVAAVSIDENSTVDDYVAHMRDRLITTMTKSEPSSLGAASGLSGLSGLSAAINRSNSILNATAEPERRTEEEYLEAIHQWESESRTAWGAAIRKLIGSQLRPTIVKISNRTATFFHDVEVKIHLEGDVSAIDYRNPESVRDSSDLGLPAPPPIWGPKQRSIDSIAFPNRTYIPSHTTYVPASISYKNGGSVDFELNVGELRPRGTYESEDEELVLVVADKAISSVHGTWELTARDHNVVFTGEFDVATTAERDLASVARQILDLDIEDGEEGDS